MSDNVNINIQETNEIINIISSEIQEVIDINVFETDEQVILNITENVIQVNVNKLAPTEQLQSDWNQTNVAALDYIKNKPTIPSAVTNTSDLINDGEDGVNPFISLLDLPSNLILYPTTATSDVSGYVKLVTDIHDVNYNTTAVDVTTGSITGTNQLIASLITNAGLIVGNAGVFNTTTIGNIRKTAGSGNAEFYYLIYKRTSLGVEILVGTSNPTIPISSAVYTQFNTVALWDDGIFDVTDRIVLKFYASKVGGGSSPTYEFQFGGTAPVRTLVPVALSVIPTDGLSNQITDYSNATLPLTGTENIILNDGTGWKKLTWTNIKAQLKTYFDTLYQSVLGFTPENVANKSILTSLGTSDTLYPTQNAVKVYADTKFTLPALTSGSILFSNGSTIAQDNTNLFWDDTNNRLGIGTNTPAFNLDVNGNSFISSATVGTGIAPLVVKNTIPYQSPFTQFIQVWQNSVGGVLAAVRADGRILSSNDMQSNYFVGIIAGSQTAPIFRLGNNGIFFPSSTSIGFSTAANERMRITDTGNVAIGTTTAGARLDVRAQGSLSTDIAFRVRNSADNANLFDVNGAGGVSINSTTQGFLPPRMTTAQKNAITSPTAGLVVYDSTLNKLCIRTALAWETITSI